MKTDGNRPENIGDIFAVENYLSCGGVDYGVAAHFPDGDRLYWHIWMQDGDIYPWPDGDEAPDLFADAIRLVRRNPLPKSER